MKEAIAKAGALIEAMEYIRRFRGRIVVVKLGLLFLRKGNWQGKQLISEKWIRMVQVPTPTKSNYGYMWWVWQGPSLGPLNNIYTATGFGGNHILVDEKHDLVVVVRWMQKGVPFIQKVVAAIVEK